MKLWGVLCSLVCLTNFLNAHQVDNLDHTEENLGKAPLIHINNETINDPLQNKKNEPAPFLKEENEKISVSKEEADIPEPYIIITTDQEKLSNAKGGGILQLDPKISNQPSPFLPPSHDSWWQNLWRTISLWFCEKESQK